VEVLVVFVVVVLLVLVGRTVGYLVTHSGYFCRVSGMHTDETFLYPTLQAHLYPVQYEFVVWLQSVWPTAFTVSRAIVISPISATIFFDI